MTDALVGLAAQLKPAPGVRLRQGVIQVVAADGSVTVTVGQAPTPLAGVRVAAAVCPLPGAACWLVTDGRDWMVWALLTPAGAALGTARSIAPFSVPTGVPTAMSWATRTDVTVRGMTSDEAGLHVVVPGVYTVTATTPLTVPSQIRVSRNGAVAVAGAAGLIACAAGDTLTFDVMQTTGVTQTTVQAAGYGTLSALWVASTT